MAEFTAGSTGRPQFLLESGDTLTRGVRLPGLIPLHKEQQTSDDEEDLLLLRKPSQSAGII